MKNAEIARIFNNISTILDIQRENRFRVLAYEKAADTILNITQDLEDIYKDGGIEALQNIENIGEDLSKKIEELLHTGTLAYYQDLLKKIPESVLELTQVPGIGPRTAHTLYTELKIDSIEKLEKAALEHKIQKLEGFKEQSEQNILRGIEQYRVRTKERNRLLISHAEQIAKDVVSVIQEVPGVDTVDIVGSLRRRKETIGDIDIVIAAQSAAPVFDVLEKASWYKKKINRGKTKLSFIHADDVRVDIELLPKKDYGSLLQHFTGSKEHNVALRTYAKERDLQLSEYGIKNIKTGKVRHFSKEEDVYKALGMAYILPELREDRGEIEAALSNSLPNLIELDDIKGDIHSHTIYSDGNNSVEEMIEAAARRGYEYYGISDHTSGLGVASGLSDEALEKHISRIHAAGKKYKNMAVLAGAEVNILADGKLDVSDEVLKKLDYVIASVHSSFNQEEGNMTKRILTAIAHPAVTVLGHPSGRLIGERVEYAADWDAIFKACAKENVALEINSFPQRLDLKDIYIRAALSYGCVFCINTDAHDTAHLDGIKYGVWTARRGWAEKKDLINTLPLKQFTSWLSQNRG